jgi:hypothetical protein
MAERWRKVRGWPYQVSDLGHVRSRFQVLTPTPDKDGYLYVTLRDGRRCWRAGVHVLVLRTWHRAPRRGEEACHENGVRSDCALVNLRWDTHEANIRDKRKQNNQIGTGTYPLTAGTRGTAEQPCELS